MIFRREIGWLVAKSYVVSGRRASICRRCREERLVVPVLFHCPSPARLDAILGELAGLVGADAIELSFDDGRREARDCVPVLEKYGVPAVFFISPGEILRGYNWAESPVARQCGFARLCRLSAEERDAELAAAGIEGPSGGLLSVDDVRSMARHPLVEFGNHTWSHMSCSSRPVEEVLGEIERAQVQIEEWTGRCPSKFSYPFGHDSEELDRAIRSRGLVPYSLRPGLAPRRGDGRFRNMANEGMSIAENVGRLLTAWPDVRRMPL